MDDLVIDENTRPEDYEYAEGVAVDIRKWVSDKFCESQSFTSFRQSDCKETFKTVNDKYLAMACKFLIDQNFLICEGKRIPVYVLTETALKRLEIEHTLKRQAEIDAEEEEIRRKLRVQAQLEADRMEIKRQRAEKRKIEKENGENRHNSDNDESDEDSVTDQADRHTAKRTDTKSDLLSIREQPFAMIHNSNNINTDDNSVTDRQTLVVTELCFHSTDPTASATNNDNSIHDTGSVATLDILRIVTAAIDPSEGVCLYSTALAQVQSHFPEINMAKFDSILQEGEQANIIMKIDDQIFPI